MPGPPHYVDAALALLGEVGPADPSLGLSMKAVAHAAGVTRQTMYRHWETVAELNEDLAIFGIGVRDSWHKRIVAAPPSADPAAIISEAIGATIPDPAVGIRTAITGWPATSRARRFAQAWEAAWLDALAAWLGRHLVTVGRADREGRDLRVLAVTLTAVVDGMMTVDQARNGIDVEHQDPAVARQASEAVARLIDELTEPVRGREPSPTTSSSVSLPVPDFRPSQRRILEETFDRFRVEPFGGAASPVPGRLVDMARLARRLGVTERRLYDVWPTARDLNLDLMLAIASREQVLLEGLVVDVLDTGFGGPYVQFGQLLTSGLQTCIQEMVRPDRAHGYWCSLAALDPLLRSDLNERFDRQLDLFRTMYLALLSMTGFYRRVEVSADDYLITMIAAMSGIQRLASLHPEMLEERTIADDLDHPLLGAVNYLVARSTTTREPPTAPPSELRAAPELPPRSDTDR